MDEKYYNEDKLKKKSKLSNFTDSFKFYELTRHIYLLEYYDDEVKHYCDEMGEYLKKLEKLTDEQKLDKMMCFCSSSAPLPTCLLYSAINVWPCCYSPSVVLTSSLPSVFI